MTVLWKKLEAGLTAILAVSAAFILASCSESGSVEITEVRPLAKEEQEIRIAASDAERFRAGSVASAGETGEGTPITFNYDLPEGWEDKGRTGLRELNFSFGENGEGECYLTLLSGGGGGVDPNVNRWRGQMGLEPQTAEEIAALPRKKLFGREATFVSLDGNFTQMGSRETKENYRMLGLILASEFGAIFVKMTGPQALVEANTAAFDAFCSSLKPN